MGTATSRTSTVNMAAIRGSTRRSVASMGGVNWPMATLQGEENAALHRAVAVGDRLQERQLTSR
jgi:hypothetical protein